MSDPSRQYDQTDADNFYITQENRELRAAVVTLQTALRQQIAFCRRRAYSRETHAPLDPHAAQVYRQCADELEALLLAAPGGSEAVRTRTDTAVAVWPRTVENSGQCFERSAGMEAVIIPAKTVVHIGGIPVYLAVDTIVETALGNMALLTGHHYSHLPEPPESPPTSRPALEPTP